MVKGQGNPAYWVERIGNFEIRIKGGGEDFSWKMYKRGRLVAAGDAKSILDAIEDAKDQMQEIKDNCSWYVKRYSK